MRKALTSILLLVFVVHLAGNLVLFKIQQFHLRKEMIQRIREGVPESQLVLVKETPTNKKSIKWEDDTEFSFRGIMYDVAKTEIDKNGNTIYYCIKDDLETALVINFRKQQNQNKKTKNTRIPVLKNVIKILPERELSPLSLNINISANDSANWRYSCAYGSRSQEITAPPPRHV